MALADRLAEHAPQIGAERVGAPLVGVVASGAFLEDLLALRRISGSQIEFDRLFGLCGARALSTELTIDFTELEDARWFTRSEVAAALAGSEDAPFQAPSRWAIARTLLEDWLGADAPA